MTDTMFSDNMATYIDAAAPDFRSIFETASDDFPCDAYDIDACVEDYVDQLNIALEFFGIRVSVNGHAKMSYGSRPDDTAVREAVDSVDIYDILCAHQILVEE